MNNSTDSVPKFPARTESGLALIVALIALVALSIASVALIRSVDTGVLIAGNVAFRQSASASGDMGTEAARTWLTTHTGSTLWTDNPASAYYATHQSSTDLTGNKTPMDTSDDFDWQNKASCLPEDNAGNTVCFVIHRQCTQAGDPVLPATDCPTDKSAASSKDDSKGVVRPLSNYQQRSLNLSGGAASDSAYVVFYRITIRITGPRNSVSYVQTMIQVQAA